MVENVYKKIHVNVLRGSMVYDVNIVSIFCLNNIIFFYRRILVLAKCIIPCLNGGKCKGVNKCRCVFGFQGDHCEIGQPIKQYNNCERPCRHGYCTVNKTCRCQQGWFGKFCRRSK